MMPASWDTASQNHAGSLAALSESFSRDWIPCPFMNRKMFESSSCPGAGSNAKSSTATARP